MHQPQVIGAIIQHKVERCTTSFVHASIGKGELHSIENLSLICIFKDSNCLIC